jgi:acyl-CoA synthetase (NDP forming)
MFTVERKVGRLVEAVMRSPVTLEDLNSADRAMEDATRALQGSAIVLADYTQTRFLLAEHATHLIQMFRRHNENIERSAILVSASSAVGVLQMERVIREANHPSRRAFRDAREAASWLGEVLSVAERARLRVILPSSALD